MRVPRPVSSSLSSLTTLLFLSFPLVSTGCRVDRAEFEERVFSCNTAAPDTHACGTDDTGREMACFGGRQLGASDFCAKTCDEALISTDESLCLSSHIALRACKPSDDDTGKACEQPGLACFRTDLQTDNGVCTTMNTCDTSEDCRDPVRSVCVTTFLANEIYPLDKDDLRLNHLFCLQTGCKARGTSCSPGETCLQEVIPAAARPPDICVPNCDSHDRCPPNFLCYSKASTDASPNVCIPGLLGFTCESDIDCMIGTCEPKSTGYKVCTTRCDTTADCQKFDGPQGTFICVKNSAAPTEHGYCETPNAYRGTICDTTDDCAKNPLDVCTHLVPGSVQGVCLPPCSPDGKCKERGGINHTCVPSTVSSEPPVCYPGYFGYPCGADTNCVGDLTCQPTSATQAACTVTCAADADCAANRWIGGEGWCAKAPSNSICLPAHVLPNDSPCTTNVACASGKCSKTTGTCTP